MDHSMVPTLTAVESCTGCATSAWVPTSDAINPSTPGDVPDITRGNAHYWHIMYATGRA